MKRSLVFFLVGFGAFAGATLAARAQAPAPAELLHNPRLKAGHVVVAEQVARPNRCRTSVPMSRSTGSSATR